MTEKQTLNFLFICAHPDDDCVVGGTMKKLSDRGWGVYEIVCGVGKNGAKTPEEANNIKKIRMEETKNYCKLLGVNEPIFLDPSKTLIMENEETVLEIVKLMRQTRPDVIVLLNKEDYHFEHINSHKMGLLAFEIASRKTLLELGEPLKRGIILQTDGLNLLANPLITFNTSDAHEQKVKAMKEAYNIRLGDNLIGFVDGLAVTRGNRVGCRYAESFEMLNPNWYKFKEESAEILCRFVKEGSK